jgi:hypothetical protein
VSFMSSPPPRSTVYNLAERDMVRLPNCMNYIDAEHVQSELKMTLNKLHMDRWAVAMCIATLPHFAIHVSKENLEFGSSPNSQTEAGFCSQ